MAQKIFLSSEEMKGKLEAISAGFCGLLGLESDLCLCSLPAYFVHVFFFCTL